MTFLLLVMFTLLGVSLLLAGALYFNETLVITGILVLLFVTFGIIFCSGQY